eukprot:NODE_58_length_28395_cov_1.465720.p30 type:complete len:105 gc:universal NODE_58_length_28395_cov_1.465720:23952-24266(+)
MLCLNNKLIRGEGICDKKGLYNGDALYSNNPRKVQLYILDDELLYADSINIDGQIEEVHPLLAPLPRLFNPQPNKEQSGGIKWYWWLLLGWFVLNILGGASAAK